ncbi:glycosyl hydrolase family 61-domain-containing protein [Mycena crocata]|nr:glycosyl hydrolase family 61-domain-containing protein [Mycena crocata]
MKTFTCTLFSASLIASAAAHGWVGTLTIGNKAYPGNKPTQEQPKGAPSVIRQIADNQPIKDLSSQEIICGRDAKPAALVAEAAAGSKVLVDWATAMADGNWFHDVGPMQTYMASCGSKSCDKFDAKEARWFKISEQGQDASGNWAQTKLDDGSPASVTLPSNLKAGHYLFRHEIIALHTAQNIGNAEFYLGCAQLKVTGSGTGIPAESELVKFPGAYKAADKGIFVDVYNMKTKYKFPGPPVAAFASGAAPPADDPPSPAEPAETTKAATTHKATSTKAATTKAAAGTTKAPAGTTKAAGATTTQKAATTTAKAATTTSKGAAASTPKTCKGKHRRRALDLEARAKTDVRRSRAKHLHRVVPRSL